VPLPLAFLDLLVLLLNCRCSLRNTQLFCLDCENVVKDDAGAKLHTALLLDANKTVVSVVMAVEYFILFLFLFLYPQFFIFRSDDVNESIELVSLWLFLFAIVAEQ
jgi:hypothetical protein